MVSEKRSGGPRLCNTNDKNVWAEGPTHFSFLLHNLGPGLHVAGFWKLSKLYTLYIYLFIYLFYVFEFRPGPPDSPKNRQGRRPRTPPDIVDQPHAGVGDRLATLMVSRAQHRVLHQTAPHRTRPLHHHRHCTTPHHSTNTTATGIPGIGCHGNVSLDKA
jgi:hypothetical protein